MTPESDRELGRGGDLGLNATESADHLDGGQLTDGIDELAPHPPGQRLGPAHFHDHVP